MNKTIALTAIIAALAGGAAVAQSGGAADVYAYGPQSIAEVRDAGQGIIVGTVTEVDRRGFTLADAGDRMRIMSRHMGPDAVQPGQQATVVGRMEHGRMQAREIVRDDGTPAPRDRHAQREQHEGRRDQHEGRRSQHDSRRDRHEAQRSQHENRHGQGGHHGQASRSQPRQQEHRSH